MKKFNIENFSHKLDTKEKISILSLEDKITKYLLYTSDLTFDENDINSNLFSKMEFNENFNILPKKRFSDLKLNVQKNTKNNKYALYINKNHEQRLQEERIDHNRSANQKNIQNSPSMGLFF
jgi:hypothetical protein